MSRILFAWELGGGFGHLGPLLSVAERLVARGHEVTLAAREVQSAETVFGSLPVAIVQAPLCTKTYNGLAEPPLNFAEILMRYGYLDAPELRGLVRAWCGLFDLAKIEFVLAEHAPTALLAARGKHTARATIGNPFAVPPPFSPTPNMREWVDVPAQRLANSDAAVLNTINASMPAGMARMGAVHEIFQDAETLFFGVPELDPYGPRDSASYFGLYAGQFGTAPPRWPDGQGPRIFAYLNGEYRHIEAALAALAASGARCLVYMRGALPALGQKYQGTRVSFSDRPVDVEAAVAGSDLCVCHGSFNTAMNILRGGKPMLLLPMQLEQFLLASKIERLGAAGVVHPEAQPLDIAGALALALQNRSLPQAARAFALKHREPPVDTIMERAASRIEALARTQGKPG